MPNTGSGQGAPPKKATGSTKKSGSAKSGSAKSGSARKTAATTRFAERQARKEEAARQARQARNKRYAFFAIGLVIVLIAVLVIVKFAGGGGGSNTVDQASPPRGNPDPGGHAGQDLVGAHVDAEQRADRWHPDRTSIGERQGADG